MSKKTGKATKTSGTGSSSEEEVKGQIVVNLDKLPTLEKAEFVAILQWEVDLKKALNKVFPKPQFPAHILVAEEIIETALALCKKQAFPEGLQDATKLLYEAFSPKSAIARVELLRKLKWPTLREGEGLTPSAVWYSNHYKRAVEVLKITDEGAIQIFEEGLHGGLAHHVKKLRYAVKCLTLADFLSVVIQAAQELDEMKAQGFSYTGNRAVEAQQHERKKKFDIPAKKPSYYQHVDVTRNSYQDRKKGLCFICHRKGHLAIECPEREERRTTQTEPTPMTSSSTTTTTTRSRPAVHSVTEKKPQIKISKKVPSEETTNAYVECISSEEKTNYKVFIVFWIQEVNSQRSMSTMHKPRDYKFQKERLFN